MRARRVDQLFMGKLMSRPSAGVGMWQTWYRQEAVARQLTDREAEVSVADEGGLRLLNEGLGMGARWWLGH